MSHEYLPIIPTQEPEMEQLQIPLMPPEWYIHKQQQEIKQEKDNTYEVDYTIDRDKEENSRVVIFEM